MIETSRDILNIVLAFSVIWVAIFLSWFLYYLGKTMKNINEIIEDAGHKVKSLFSAIDYIREKIGIISGAAGYLIQSFLGREKEENENENNKFGKKRKKK